MCAQVSILYTAPTAIRALQSFGDSWPAQYSRASLRILGTVGEPINPEAWQWYHEVTPPTSLPFHSSGHEPSWCFRRCWHMKKTLSQL